MLLPFQPRWLPLTLGMMIFGLFWLLSGQFKSKLGQLAANAPATLFFAYYLWMAVGAIYSPLPAEAEKDLLLKIPFMVWPLVLGSITVFTLKDQRALLKVFIAACTLSILLCFVWALGAYMESGLLSEFFFTELVDYKVIPPHYLGMYASFAYGCLLYRSLRKEFFFSRSVDGLMLVVLAIGIIFISVRMQYVIFLLLNGAVLFAFTYARRGVLPATLILLGTIILFGSLAWAFPGSKRRIRDTYHEIVSFEKAVNQKQTNPRKFLWSEGWQVIRTHWLWGTGTGAATAALQVELADNQAKFWDGQNVYYLRDRNYNLHNTYLEHWANNGLIGFTLLLAVMIFPVFRAIPGEGKVFLGVCAFSFITESMLERQAGVLFFSFFYSLFFILKTPAAIHQHREEHTK